MSNDIYVRTVGIAAVEAGCGFVDAGVSAKAQFLRAMECATNEHWEHQCKLISAEIGRQVEIETNRTHGRQRVNAVATMLETLAYQIRNQKCGFVDDEQRGTK